VGWRVKAHSSIHPVPIVMWMVVLIHVGVRDLWLGLWVVNEMVVVLWARTILLRSLIMMILVRS
jgi:hypothetical protein